MLTGRFLLLAAALAGCGGADRDAELPGAVAVDVMLDDAAGLSILAVYPVEEMAALAEGGPPELGWQLISGGEVLAAGTLHDPRFIRSESGMDVQTSFGSASLRLPARAGDLVFLAGEVEIARAAFDPGRFQHQVSVGMTRSPLLREGDVQGPAARILGTLERARAVDLLILAEGYTETQLDRFRRDALAIGKSFRSIMSRQRKWGGRFNIWIQSVGSRSVGIDDPDAGRRADTAFDVGFGRGDSHRCTWFNTAAGQDAARALGREAGADVTVVLANTTGHGGCASSGLFVVTRSVDAPWVVAHELGHALIGLADEYESGTCRVQAAPNLAFSATRALIPWGPSIAAGTPLPTPETRENARVVGAFTGASYCRNDAWRPQLNCLMRELHRGFCRVCLGRMDLFLRTLNRTGQGGGTPGGGGDDGGDPGGGGLGCGNGACDGDETDASCPGDCGCAASDDCVLAPYGCYCDPSCSSTGDCCADACSACTSC